MHKSLNKGGNNGGINKAYYLQLAKSIYNKGFFYFCCLFACQSKIISK